MTLSAAPATLDQFNNSKQKTVYAMTRYGGSFVKALGAALATADGNNTRRLYEAFADLIAPYAPGGRFHNVD